MDLRLTGTENITEVARGTDGTRIVEIDGVRYLQDLAGDWPPDEVRPLRDLSPGAMSAVSDAYPELDIVW